MDKESFLLILSSSVSGIIWGANILIIPLYFKSLGLTPVEIGILLGGSVLLGSLLSLFWAVLGDAYGRKKFAILSRGINSVSLFLLISSPLPYLLSTQGGYGLISALISERSEKIDNLFAYRSSLQTGFSMLGSLLPLFLSYKEIILIDVFIATASTVMLFPVKEKYRGSGKVRLNISSLRLIGKLSTESIIGLGAGILLPMLSLWFNLRFGVSASSLSPFYTTSQFTLALGSLMSPKLGRLLGKIRAIFITHLIAIVLLFTIPFAPNFLIAGLLYIGRNVMMNMTGPLMSSFVMNMVREEERGRASSLLQLLDSIPRSLGPYLTGYLLTLRDFYLPFFITGSLYLIATIMFYLFFKDVRLS
ncbi:MULTISPECIES: MFS transporter [Acidianus]|uniref:MFS transporter n=1 Tax=Candidatus Acidianus copahuensis TaxID=1160895 RepID=A0A031LV04_9CREN|nr:MULTISPECIES: MFS transporter [Acidianus]EZQ11334.1 MFS transporter [Candidatus Acidianus copahuensis]NON63452.1 MFS transporter [Acidianus sp. RZ1]